MNNSNTLFDLQQAHDDAVFVAHNADLELEVGSDILETAMNIPYIGSLLKLGKVAIGFIDYRFFRKLEQFLKNVNEIPEEKIMNFIDSLSPKDKKRISDYLTQLLYTADEEEKADIMGKIYVRRVLREIDNKMMLRLCSIVSRAYIADLYSLKEYLDVSEANTFVTDNLVALGVLADAGNIYKESNDGWEGTSFGPTKHILNEIGVTLFQILSNLPITNIHIKRIQKHEILNRSMTETEIDDIIK